MLIRNGLVNGRPTELRVSSQSAQIDAMATHLEPLPGEEVIDACGGEVLPGLHDHHMHLFAAAAARNSIDCGQIPSAQRFVGNPEGDFLDQAREEFAQLLTGHSGRGWLRGMNWHEQLLGELDRWSLDALINVRPVRIQHRSGMLWVLNSQAVEALELAKFVGLPGLEVNDRGVPTGRLFRQDDWLRERLGMAAMPDILGLSEYMLSLGLTSFTDTSATNGRSMLETFSALKSSGDLVQSYTLMGNDSLPQGHLKILLDEDALPDLDNLITRIVTARQQGRRVAFHCITHIELLFALAALDAAREVAGVRSGEALRGVDRIEHGSVIRDEVLPRLTDHKLAVVTQPGLIAARGDFYRRDLSPGDLNCLYRHKSLLQAGVTTIVSSDAPYGPMSPWVSMSAAVNRRTPSGHVIGADEVVSPEEAISGYLSRPLDLQQASHRLAVGACADLCVLQQPWRIVRTDPASAEVFFTVVAGEIVYRNTTSPPR